MSHRGGGGEWEKGVEECKKGSGVHSVRLGTVRKVIFLSETHVRSLLLGQRLYQRVHTDIPRLPDKLTGNDMSYLQMRAEKHAAEIV